MKFSESHVEDAALEWLSGRLCCKPDEGARCSRQENVLDLCFCAGQTVV